MKKRGRPRNWDKLYLKLARWRRLDEREYLRGLVPSLRVACRRAGVSHWHVSRTIGRGNWPLLYLSQCGHWSQRALARAFGLARSRICVKLQQIRARLAKAGYTVGPAAPHRRRRTFTFSDCRGPNRESLQDAVGYFEPLPRLRRGTSRGRETGSDKRL